MLNAKEVKEKANKMTNDEIIDTLEYFKLHFVKDKKAVEHFDKAIEIIEADSNRKASKSTVSIKSIKSCPHLLPCGFCDKTGILCSQYE